MPVTRPAAIIAGALLLFALPSSAGRLPRTVIPHHYDLTISPDYARNAFDGETRIDVSVQQPVREIRLHALAMNISEAAVTAGGEKLSATVRIDEKAQEAILTLPRNIAPGLASISLRYSAPLNEKLVGLYRGKAGDRPYVATQMQPIDARRMFPSFDEPDFKATFAITAIVDAADRVMSNGKIISETPGPQAGRKTVRFATTPRMSTYLVALVSGPFECLSGEQDGVPIRVCAVKGKEHLGRFAMEVSKHAIRFFNRYHEIPFPFEKLDQVALPDFGQGAMENSGLITYREEYLLFDEKNGSEIARRGCAATIAHEISHHWFGDLVTMQWWDDIWLNEGFATWAADKANEDFDRKLRARDFTVTAAAYAKGVDAYDATRAVRHLAASDAELTTLFDSIAYSKTSAVLKMVEQYAGPERFREGVNRYLRKHAWGNATADDFIRSVAEASVPESRAILNSFVEIPGFARVSFDHSCSRNTTTLDFSQTRFRLKGSAAEPSSWTIPVCVRALDSGRRQCFVLDRGANKFTVDGCASGWLLNPDYDGYFAVDYSPAALNGVRAHIAKLNVRDKVGLLDDIWRATYAGQRPIVPYLDLVDSLRSERDTEVLQQILGHLFYLRKAADGNATTRAHLDEWSRGFLRPILADLGWERRPGDTEEQRELRRAVVGALAFANDSDVIRRARSLAMRLLKDENAIDGSLARTVIPVAALGADDQYFDALVAAYRTGKGTPEHRRRLVRALSYVSDPRLAARSRELAMTDTIGSADRWSLLTLPMMHSPEMRRAGWDYMKANRSAIVKHLPQGQEQWVFYAAAGHMCSREERDDVERTFTAAPIEGTERDLKKTLQGIEACVAFREAQTADLARWLERR